MLATVHIVLLLLLCIVIIIIAAFISCNFAAAVYIVTCLLLFGRS